jgi:hypothetical protein
MRPDIPGELSHADIVRYISETLIRDYVTIPTQTKTVENPTVYSSNREFWKDIIAEKLHPGMGVRLKNFCIIEWIPFSPGLYFTDHAEKTRREIEDIVNSLEHPYVPANKLKMIRSGIGSVRLSGDNDRHFFGATSNGVSHEGIPLILDWDLYSQYITMVGTVGYFVADVTGTIKLVPKGENIKYENEIPKYVISVDRIEPTVFEEMEIEVSIAVPYFTTNEHHETGKMAYTYCVFYPCKDFNLKAAVDWIQSYAMEHSESDKPIQFVANFDDLMDHLSSSVEVALSRSEISNTGYENKWIKIDNQNIYNMGNLKVDNSTRTISNNSAPVTVGGRDVKISGSFNNESTEVLASDLQRIYDLLIEEKNEKAKQAFEGFKSEIEKPVEKRNTAMLRVVWDGIVAMVPTIKSLAEVYERVSNMF